MSNEKQVVKGINPTTRAAVKGQGQPKQRPETAQQVTVTKPAPAAPPPKKSK